MKKLISIVEGSLQAFVAVGALAVLLLRYPPHLNGGEGRPERPQGI